MTSLQGVRRPSLARKREGRRKAAEIVLFVGPALVLFFGFVIYPMLKAVQISGFRWKGYGPMENFVAFENYLSVLKNPVFQGALTNNLVIMVASIAIQLPLGLIVALLLNRKMRGRNLMRTIVFIPYVLAEVIAGVVWYQMLQPERGVVDTLLGFIGLSGPTQGWLGDPKYALATVMVVLTWKYLGLAIILFLAGLQTVPDELHEAAQIDGASWLKTQLKITIPLLGPTMRMWAFLSMIGSLQLFDMVWILTKGGPVDSTITMAIFLVVEGTKRSNYGIAAAASVILFLIALVFSLVYQRFVLNRDNQADSARAARKAAKAAAQKAVAK